MREILESLGAYFASMSLQLTAAISHAWWLGAISSFVSVGTTVRTFLLDRRARLRKLEASRDEAFFAAMNSSELTTLGSYLESTLCTFTIAEYAGDKHVNARVDQMMKRLRAYVGTTEEIQHTKVGRDPIVESERTEHPDSDFALTQAPLDVGERWNVLAAFRRQIEVLLHQIARSHQIEMPEHASAGRLLSGLKASGIISVNTDVVLRRAIEIASRAIHGFDVTDEEANEAVRLATVGLEMLRQKAARH